MALAEDEAVPLRRAGICGVNPQHRKEIADREVAADVTKLSAPDHLNNTPANVLRMAPKPFHALL